MPSQYKKYLKPQCLNVLSPTAIMYSTSKEQMLKEQIRETAQSFSALVFLAVSKEISVLLVITLRKHLCFLTVKLSDEMPLKKWCYIIKFIL